MKLENINQASSLFIELYDIKTEIEQAKGIPHYVRFYHKGEQIILLRYEPTDKEGVELMEKLHSLAIQKLHVRLTEVRKQIEDL